MKLTISSSTGHFATSPYRHRGAADPGDISDLLGQPAGDNRGHRADRQQRPSPTVSAIRTGRVIQIGRPSSMS
jgi:hypothetical protein